MSDGEIVVDVDLAHVEAGLARLHDAGHDLSAVFRASRKDLRLDQRDHAKHEQGPEGRWPALSPYTAIRRLARRGRQGSRRGRHRIGPLKLKGGRILGRLPGALDVKADRYGMIARSRAKWSGVHQDGGSTGRGQRVPARPFLWISDRLLRAVVVRIDEKLSAAWRGVGG